MKCNCIKKVNAELKRMTGDKDAELNTGIDFNTGEAFLYNEYTFRRKTQKEKLSKKKYVGTMVSTFCPFCGINLKEK
jgi:hypothetical protein